MHNLRRAALCSTVIILGSVIVSDAHQGACPLAPGFGQQPFELEDSSAGTAMATIFDLAGENQLGSRGPTYLKISDGLPPNLTKVPPLIPRVILKAIGVIESNWRQFNAEPGNWCETLHHHEVDADGMPTGECGYGVMQITSGMDGSGNGFDPDRVNGDYVYNIGTGALFLIYKWNLNLGFIGHNDSDVMEDWYYAVWAYNSWGWVNNPNNTDRYPPNRPPFDGSQPRANYPFQELVWGYAANPPTNAEGRKLYNPVALTLPAREQLTDPPPQFMPDPIPNHRESDTQPTLAAFRIRRDSGNILTDGVYNCRLSANCFNSGIGMDVAEHVDVDEAVEPGDVVEADAQRPKFYRKVRRPYSPLAVGVISSQPGMTLGNGLEEWALGLKPAADDTPQQWGEETLNYLLTLGRATALPLGLTLTELIEPESEMAVSIMQWSERERRQRLGRLFLALVGRVQVRATTENGPIQPGDLLVSASIPGYVMRCIDLTACDGAIVGKALEPLREGKGLILALLTH